MQTGTIISGIGHGALIFWALFGGLFLRARDVPQPSVSEVSVISAEEFAALTAPDVPPAVATETETPEPPSPDAAPEAGPAPETRPETPDPPPAETAEPEPEAAPQPPPEPLPRPAEVDPEVPESPEPPAPDPGAEVESRPDSVPTPPEAPRIAPEATPEPPPDAAIAETAEPEVADTENPAEVVEEEQRPETAPEEATTEIVTEAEKPSAAPTASVRPRSRPPERPVAVAEERPARPPEEDAVDAALAEALGGDEGQAGTAEERPETPTGPPLTQGEKGEFALAVKRCWVVDPGSESARIVVDIGFEMTPDGMVVGNSLRMIRATDGPDAAVKSAYEAGRRAILRCGARGFDLPAEKYAQWREVEISFDPSNMRLR